MSDGSAIQWTDATWGPVVGCTPVSAGCANCYAKEMTYRLERMGKAKYHGLAVLQPNGKRHFNGVVRTVPEALPLPLGWKKPRRVFVNSMSDLFHEAVPFAFVDQVFAVMALCPQHTFQILTKRPERMAEYLATRTPIDRSSRVDRMPQWYQVATAMLDEGADSMPRGAWDRAHDHMPDPSLPLPNVWLGTSVENQAAANERIPHLLRCPAKLRFLSCEPLLGPLDLSKWITLYDQRLTHIGGRYDEDLHAAANKVGAFERLEAWALHWVIVGGESGKDARPSNLAWHRSLRDQCKAAGVAFYEKQLGPRPEPGYWQTDEVGHRCGAVGHTRRWYVDDTTQFPVKARAICDSHGGDPAEWPEDLRVREFPQVAATA